MLPPNIACRNPINVRGDAHAGAVRRGGRGRARRSAGRRGAGAARAAAGRRGHRRGARRRGGRAASRRSRCWRRGSARSTGARRPTRSRRAASPISTRRRTRSTRSRSSPRIAATRNGCSRCRRRSPSRSRRISRAVERMRTDAAPPSASVLTEMETHALLAAFGMPVAPAAVGRHARPKRCAAARRLGYPGDAALRCATRSCRPASASRASVCATARMLTRAWAAMLGAPAQRAPARARHRGEGTRVRRAARASRSASATDAGVRARDHVRRGSARAAAPTSPCCCRRSTSGSRAT